jgi:Domain of unknown function (DUF4296)
VLLQDLKRCLLATPHVSRQMLLCLILLFQCACANEDPPPKPPPYVLSPDSFTELLVDFALAESAIGINILNVRGHQIDSTYAFDPLREHGVSAANYDSTVAYYSRHPDQYREVYQKVLTRLSALESARKTHPADSSSPAKQ